MKNIFLKPSDSVLTKVAKQIPKSQINSSGIKEIVEIMLRAAQGEQKGKKKPILVGLAAPQIGILKRIILVDVKANGKGKIGDLRVYINPEITWSSQKQSAWYEGCYSTSKVCGIVSRPISIKIKALEAKYRFANRIPIQFRKFEEVDRKYTGYVARIFQHEIDHLNGILFPDLIKDPSHLHWVNRNEFKLYRNRQAWRNWPEKCSFEKWLKIKKPLLNKA